MGGASKKVRRSSAGKAQWEVRRQVRRPSARGSQWEVSARLGAVGEEGLLGGSTPVSASTIENGSPVGASVINEEDPVGGATKSTD